MLQTTVVGNIGAAPQTQSANGKEFTTFRIAHNDTWKDDAGNQHSNTVWVDCIMSGKPNVIQYLTPGTQVFVSGDTKLRVYSSQKDRCMKAGLQIKVNVIELLGGKRDDVPSRLYDSNGVQHDVSKWYLTDIKDTTLMSQQGRQFSVDANGWVKPIEPTQTDNNNGNEQIPDHF